MSRGNVGPIKNRLTTEQEAQLFSLLVIQNNLRYKIITPFSMLLSSLLIPSLVPLIFLVKYKSFQDFLVSIYSKMIDISPNDKVMMARYYDLLKNHIGQHILNFRTVLNTVVTAKNISIETIMANYESLTKENFFEKFSSEDTAKLIEIKKALISIYVNLNYLNPHHPDSMVKAGINPSETVEVTEQIYTKFIKTSMVKLRELIIENIKTLQNDMEIYSKVDYVSLSARSLLSVSPTEKNLLLFTFAYISVATIASSILVIEPLLVKLFSLFDRSNKRYKPTLLYNLKEREANKLILELKNYNNKLSSIAKVITFFHLLLSVFFALFLIDNILGKDSLILNLSILFISFFSMYVKALVKLGYSCYQDFCLDSRLQQRVRFLNQITFTSNQKSWLVTKNDTLSASWYSLSATSKKQLSAETICTAIKYSFMLYGINTIADDMDNIIVPGDIRCDSRKIEMIKNNLEQSLDRLNKLKKLKKDFLRIAKLTGGHYKYYVKRDKNHSIVAVLTQEILPDHQNILTLGHLKSIFVNFTIKIADGKLLLKGFEPIDQETEQKFRQLLHSSREEIRLEPLNNPTSSPIESISKYLRISSRSQALPSNPPVAKKESQYIRWGKDVVYNSEDRTCNVYKFQSSSQKNLFVLSKLTREDFQDQAGFDHFLDKIKNPKRVAAKGEQGFVRVPDLSCRDNKGDRFLARWKLKLLGAQVGYLRGMCEEIRAETGERLIVVRSLADHKSVAKMYKK